jgi:polysaccharide export outer membrane protein
MMRTLLPVLIAASALLSGCVGGPGLDPAKMTAANVVDLQAAHVASAPQAEYQIAVSDKLSVRVFQVPDLSFDELTVDTSGNIQMPLIGAVQAAGLTSGELSANIAEKLGSQYLRNPQVTVTVTDAAGQKITIDGAVVKPGVYEMSGSTSLLQAVAMAEGPTNVADLTSVAVFRTINGQRSVALFDLAAIRQGRASDPTVLGDDVIVVDISKLNRSFREIVGALPALAIFAAF